MLEKLEWELALLLNGRADCAYTGEWRMVRDYDRRISEKENEIKQARKEIEQLSRQLWPSAKVTI